MHPGQRDFVDDSSDSWDDKDYDDNDVELAKMGASVMNSNHESKELHSLDESSSNDDIGDDSGDNFDAEISTLVRKERVQKLT